MGGCCESAGGPQVAHFGPKYLEKTLVRASRRLFIRVQSGEGARVTECKRGKRYGMHVECVVIVAET